VNGPGITEDGGLPDVVRQLVLRYIDSVAELEGLLLMRAETASPWEASRLARRLYIKDRAAKDVLHALFRRGLLSREGEAFCYAPESDALRASVDRLAVAYPRFLIPITNLIHAKPRPGLREFADAFRFREDT
jgi:hypothetical protein